MFDLFIRFPVNNILMLLFLCFAIPSDVACELWDCTTFKLTYFVDSVSRSSFWTSLVSTTSHFSVIPDCILTKCYDYTPNDLISTIYIGNKTFHIKIDTVDGKVGFTNGIDVIVSQFQLEGGCYLVFTNFFGNYFHLRSFGKNGVEKNFADVDVEEAVVALIDSVHDVSPISVAAPAVAKQPHGRRYQFVRMAATYFRLPDTVSRMAKLDFGLKPIAIRLRHWSPQKEFINGTRREKKDNSFRYTLTSWLRFMKSAGIQVGDTVYYSFEEINIYRMKTKKTKPKCQRTNQYASCEVQPFQHSRVGQFHQKNNKSCHPPECQQIS
ncbi:hypothetical protein HanOQP8_Chr04g0161071 [Helianthus annuus]|nr:hypothetical protein HanOQP8_Chr04g0161071 [Helianthus annuus]